MVDNSSTIDHKQASSLNHTNIRNSRIPTTKAIAGYTKENDPESTMEAAKLVGHPKAAAGTSITVTKQGKAQSAEQTLYRHTFKKNKGKEKTSKRTGDMKNTWSESINPNGTMTEPYGKNEIKSPDAGLSHLNETAHHNLNKNPDINKKLTVWFIENGGITNKEEAQHHAKHATNEFLISSVAELETQFQIPVKEECWTLVKHKQPKREKKRKTCAAATLHQHTRCTNKKKNNASDAMTTPPFPKTPYHRISNLMTDKYSRRSTTSEKACSKIDNDKHLTGPPKLKTG